MFELWKRDQVRELTNIPHWDPGYSGAQVLATDGKLVLTYRHANDEKIVTIEFVAAHVHIFGAPNDETLNGHRLYKRGLRPYGAFEIERSSWIVQLEAINSAHPSHDSNKFRELRHFLFSFHDNTFECIAKAFEVSYSAALSPD